MLRYANFQFKIFNSQMMVIFEILRPSELIRYWFFLSSAGTGKNPENGANALILKLLFAK